MQSFSPSTDNYALKWCAEQAISTQEAITRITGMQSVAPIRENFEAVFSVCDKVAKSLSVRMGGAANMDLLYYVSEYVEASSIMETGVSYGWSSLSFLLSLTSRPNTLLVSTDIPYASWDSDKYTGCVVPNSLKYCWRIIKLLDREGIPKALEVNDRLDVCHYDSDKSYDGRLWAYPLMWKALRCGGYFISDDVSDNLGFYDFCKNLKVEPLIVETPRRSPQLKKYVGIFQKL